MPGLDLSKLASIQEEVENSERGTKLNQPQSTTNKASARGAMALISPRAEMAKNALAERAKAGKEEEGFGTDRNEDEDMTEQVYVDFSSTYEDDTWWLDAKQPQEQ